MSLSPQRAANLAENPNAGQGAVVLDIGDGRGAIIAHLSAADEGAEVEIESLDGAASEAELVELHAHEHAPAPAHEHPHEHEHEHEHQHEHAHDEPVAPRPHVAVLGRPTPSGEVIYSAVFPSLPVGTYRLHERDSGRSHEVVVTDATVTEVDWSAPTP
ncbi:hypothetical protein V3N99_10755 [Dermatophilaceae bacterium Soc4.6]